MFGVDDNEDNPANRTAVISNNPVSTTDYFYRRMRAKVADVRVTVTDDDTAGVTVVGSPVVAENGGTGTYTMVLTSQPTGNVTITPTSSDETIATVSGVLTFTALNWNQTQQVTVTGVDDNVVNAGGNRETTITHVMAGADYGAVRADAVNVQVTDDDTAGVTVVGSPVVDENGGTGTYTIRLNTQPADNVIITPTSSDKTIATVSGALTFTAENWNQTQQVTVTGVNDNVVNAGGNREMTITHVMAGADYGMVDIGNITVRVTDDDSITVTVEGSPVVSENGGIGIYTMVLNSKPTGPVTITPTSSDETIATVSGTLTFIPANWNTRQEVTVTGVNDNIDNPNDQRETIIRHAIKGGGYAAVEIENVRVEVAADDAAPTGITLLVNPSSIGESEGKIVGENQVQTKVTVTATVTGDTTYGVDQSVMVSVLDATAEEGYDFWAEYSFFEIIVSAGSKSATGTFDLTLVNDNIAEGNETVTIKGRFGGNADDYR